VDAGGPAVATYLTNIAMGNLSVVSALKEQNQDQESSSKPSQTKEETPVHTPETTSILDSDDEIDLSEPPEYKYVFSD
jgi:hypothetical protein